MDTPDAPRPQRTFVVTTRSHLRGPHLFPVMYRASQRIQRELEGTPGAVRAVSVVAGPVEFWTVSVWDSRHLMQEFMRSGAHGRIMWEISRWLDSFWLMRWRPTRHEHGTWSGLSLAPPARRSEEHGAPEEVREAVLGSIPNLREAIGSRGAPTYDAAPTVREQRELVEGAGGVLLRIAAPWHRTGAALSEVRSLRERLQREDPRLLRVVAGLGDVGTAWLLGVWRERGAAARLVDSERLQALRGRWGRGVWVGELVPDNEFGRWDGLRLRDLGEDGRLGTRETVG